LSIIQIKDNLISLYPEKFLYIEKDHLVIVSDLHIGKIDHFRNSGIPLPYQSSQQTMSNLEKILHSIPVSEVFFLGDLFHSTLNESFIHFQNFIARNTKINFTLILGNHDKYPLNLYSKMGLTVVNNIIHNNLIFTHEPIENYADNELYNICGHIHPALVLKGKGRQSLRLPCFYFDKHQGILPSFGYFTGSYTITPKLGSKVFFIADGKIIPLINES